MRVIAADGHPFRLLSTRTPAGVTPLWRESASPLADYYIDVDVRCKDLGAVDGTSIIIKTDRPGESVIMIPIDVAGLSHDDDERPDTAMSTAADSK
ncbi:MAG: hypothetical protein M3552_13335 [Planctomycetota bacterium]|nr:hypothetical protein [Planctomycetota bacterium]